MSTTVTLPQGVPPHDHSLDDLLTVQEVAQRQRIAPKAVYKAKEQGRGPKGWLRPGGGKRIFLPVCCWRAYVASWESADNGPDAAAA